MQRCYQCGQEITVFVGEPAGLDWQYRPFCDACRSRLETGAGCPACKTGYASFLESGFLGCETCYTAQAGRLLSLLRAVRNPAGPEALPGPGPIAVDSLARSRTEEARSLVLEATNDSVPGTGTVPGLVWDEGGIGRSVPPGEASWPGTYLEDRAPEGGAGLSGTVLRSVRLRWARNLHGIPFWNLLDQEQRRRLAAVLVAPGSILASQRRKAGRDDALGGATFLIGDEDHFRAEWRLPLMEDERLVEKRFETLSGTLERMNRLYLWQFHRDFGALTACPANSGSGMRLSCEVQVPRLLRGGHWTAWREQLEAAGLEVRGAGGEGSRPGKDGVLQISNRSWPLGIDICQAALRIFAVLGRLSRHELRQTGS